MTPLNRNASDNLLPARGVWERYGVTSMTLYRWLAVEGMGFPRPIYLGRNRYWRISELLEWEEASRHNTGTPGAAAQVRHSTSEREVA